MRTYICQCCGRRFPALAMETDLICACCAMSVIPLAHALDAGHYWLSTERDTFDRFRKRVSIESIFNKEVGVIK